VNLSFSKLTTFTMMVIDIVFAADVQKGTICTYGSKEKIILRVFKSFVAIVIRASGATAGHVHIRTRLDWW